jgi:hypothetical protein
MSAAAGWVDFKRAGAVQHVVGIDGGDGVEITITAGANKSHGEK